jgi:hypothetical protein
METAKKSSLPDEGKLKESVTIFLDLTSYDL